MRPLPNFTIFKPTYPAGIDWGLSLAQGLVFLCPFDHTVPFDIVSGIPGTPSGTPTNTHKIDGAAVALASASSQYFSWPDRDELDILTGRTVHWRGWIASGSKYHDLVAKGTGNDSTSTPYNLLTNNDANSTVVFTTAAGGYRNWTSSRTLAADANRLRNVSVIAPPLIETAPVFLVDGDVITGTSGPFGGAGTGAPTASAIALQIGRRADGAVQLDGGVSLVAIWRMQVDPVALQELHTKPFMLFRRSAWRSRSVGVTNYTMTAETGAFVLTGNAVQFGLSMPAGVGGFVLTGNDAGLEYVAPEEEEAGADGGWADRRTVRAFLRKARAYSRAVEARREDQDRRKADLLATLERTYARITGEPIPEDIEAVAEVIAASPAQDVERKVSDAIAGYYAVIQIADTDAQLEILDRIERLFLQIQVQRHEEDDEEVIAFLEAEEADLLMSVATGLKGFVRIMEEANAALRL